MGVGGWAFDLADWTGKEGPSGYGVGSQGLGGSTGRLVASISQASQRSPADPCGSMQN